MAMANTAGSESFFDSTRNTWSPGISTTNVWINWPAEPAAS